MRTLAFQNWIGASTLGLDLIYLIASISNVDCIEDTFQSCAGRRMPSPAIDAHFGKRLHSQAIRISEPIGFYYRGLI
jgi:hypothetical protein